MPAWHVACDREVQRRRVGSLRRLLVLLAIFNRTKKGRSHAQERWRKRPGVKRGVTLPVVRALAGPGARPGSDGRRLSLRGRVRRDGRGRPARALPGVLCGAERPRFQRPRSQWPWFERFRSERGGALRGFTERPAGVRGPGRRAPLEPGEAVLQGAPADGVCVPWGSGPGRPGLSAGGEEWARRAGARGDATGSRGAAFDGGTA